MKSALEAASSEGERVGPEAGAAIAETLRRLGSHPLCPRTALAYRRTHDVWPVQGVVLRAIPAQRVAHLPRRQAAGGLAKEKLGFTLPAFGPHWSTTTEATDQALEAVSEIKIWLYGPSRPKHFARLSLQRVMALENPIFVPDPAKFKETYETVAATREFRVLQGHPDQWDDTRWAGFLKIIEFLKSKQVVFMTPSEYLKKSQGLDGTSFRGHRGAGSGSGSALRRARPDKSDLRATGDGKNLRRIAARRSENCLSGHVGSARRKPRCVDAVGDRLGHRRDRRGATAPPDRVVRRITRAVRHGH